MTAPFVDAKPPEVAARVATALVRREYNKRPATRKSGIDICQHTLEYIPVDGFPLVRTALMGLQCHLIARGRLADWKAAAIASSRLGRGFRRCFFDDYKANRRG